MKILSKPEFRTPRCGDFVRGWLALCHGRDKPDRGEFQQGIPANFNPDLLFLSLTSDGRFLTRAAGRNLITLYGFDPAGLNYLDFVEKSRRAAVLENFNCLTAPGTGMHAIATQNFPDGRCLESEAVVLPLAGDGLELVVFKHLLRDLDGERESPYPFEVNIPSLIAFFDIQAVASAA